MKRVMFWDDERSEGNSIIVTLKKGWKFNSDPLAPAHVEGFDTIQEAKQEVRLALKCNCINCKE